MQHTQLCTKWVISFDAQHGTTGGFLRCFFIIIISLMTKLWKKYSNLIHKLLNIEADDINCIFMNTCRKQWTRFCGFIGWTESTYLWVDWLLGDCISCCHFPRLLRIRSFWSWLIFYLYNFFKILMKIFFRTVYTTQQKPKQIW